MTQKKRIGLVQVNFQQGPRELNAYYLPYSVGILWSYLQSLPELRVQLELDRIVWKRDSINSVAQQLCNNDYVLFSTYVWNKNYNYKLASKIKELNPDSCLIFGGPEMPHRDTEIFQRYNFIDYVIKQEGEITLSRLLQNVEDPYQIPGLVINQAGHAIDTGNADRVIDLDVIPSPYLAGVFDTLISDNPSVEWNGTLETNRGCPYQCTFCDWGSLTYNKVKQFDLDRVLQDIEWIGEHCGHLTLADANFGMFVARDEVIAEKIIEVYHKYKKIQGTNISWAKNQKSDVLNIIKKLNQNLDGTNNGLTVSVQSMDVGVLDAIKRTNLNQHKLAEIFQLCEESHIPVYSEMILGLPNETLRSWKNGVYQIFEHGNHHGISFIQAQMLNNAEMSYGQKEFYQITTATVYDYMSSLDELGDCAEGIDLVTSTRSMPLQDMLEAQVWTSFITALHLNGITSWIARFLSRHQGVLYQDFYDGLYDIMRTDTWVQHRFTEIKQYFSRWAEHGYLDHPAIGGMQITGVTLGYRFLLDIHLDSRIDHVLQLTKKYVQAKYPLQENLVEQLFKFQFDNILTYDMLQTLPCDRTYQYDFAKYILKGDDLDHATQIRYSSKDINSAITLQRFLENLWYGRKRFYNKLEMTSMEIS